MSAGRGDRPRDDRAALAAKRASGVRLGRPVSLPSAVSKRIASERKAGRSLAAIADMLNEEQVPTAQGGRQWWPSTVRAVLRSAWRPMSSQVLVPAATHHDSERDTGRAMSDESTTPDLVELTRRAFEPTMSRDIDGIMSFYGPDAVWDLSTGGLGVFRGHAAIREFMEDWFRAYDRIETDLEEVVHLGSGVTFAVGTQKGRLAGSGGEVALRYAVINVWVNGLIERSTNYADIDEARAAAERLAVERG